MEHIDSISNAPQNHSSDSDDANNAKFTEAEIAWYKMRSEWVGDRSERLQRQPREPKPIEWGLLLSGSCDFFVPFQRPIPLAEVVRFFGDFWDRWDLDLDRD